MDKWRSWRLWNVFLVAGSVWLACMALRFWVIESETGLPRDCGPGGSDSPLGCGLAWLLVQSFHAQRLGILALLAGGLGFVSGSRPCAWVGWLCGVAGLVLYSPEQAAVGALLGLFVLLRVPA
jgi:hypothetical protein